jgi:hypothetical protein
MREYNSEVLAGKGRHVFRLCSGLQAYYMTQFVTDSEILQIFNVLFLFVQAALLPIHHLMNWNKSSLVIDNAKKD